MKDAINDAGESQKLSKEVDEFLIHFLGKLQAEYGLYPVGAMAIVVGRMQKIAEVLEHRSDFLWLIQKVAEHMEQTEPPKPPKKPKLKVVH
jgi:hypothetical protein